MSEIEPVEGSGGLKQISTSNLGTAHMIIVTIIDHEDRKWKTIQLPLANAKRFAELLGEAITQAEARA